MSYSCLNQDLGGLNRLEWKYLELPFAEGDFFEPSCIATIDRLLRRTLVRSVILITKGTKSLTFLNHSYGMVLLPHLCLSQMQIGL